MRILIQIKAVFLGLLLLFFILLPASLIALPFPLKRRLKITGPAWACFSRLLLRYACHTHIGIYEDHRGEAFRGTPCYGLYVANHQSYVDIPLIITMFQAPPIMKKEVLHIPFFGWMAWVSGALPVSRSETSSRRKVFEKAKKRILKEKIGLQVYPEGTRSKTSIPKPLNEIKRTLLVFAYNEKIPVVPVSIYGTRGVLSPNGTINPGRTIGMITHKEIDPRNYSDPAKFVEACWNQVLIGHSRMMTELGPLNES
jgi:1-acyl-sn-glycerol-3-phosphate acyltransferase